MNCEQTKERKSSFSGRMCKAARLCAVPHNPVGERREAQASRDEGRYSRGSRIAGKEGRFSWRGKGVRPLERECKDGALYSRIKEIGVREKVRGTRGDFLGRGTLREKLPVYQATIFNLSSEIGSSGQGRENDRGSQTFDSSGSYGDPQ